MGQKSGPVKEPAEQVMKAIRRATRRQFSAKEGHLRRGHRSVGDGVRGCAFRDVIFQLEDAGGAAHKFVDLSCHA